MWWPHRSRVDDSHTVCVVRAAVLLLQEWDMVWLQSALVDALDDVSDDLCGLSTEFRDVWYVQEKELMALSLDGHFTKHSSHLKCHRKAPATAAV